MNETFQKPEDKYKAIQEARSFEELFSALEKLRGLYGSERPKNIYYSSEYYPAEELKKKNKIY